MASRVPRKCGSCGESRALQGVALRVYERRLQTQYTFRLCSECRDVLHGILQHGADGWSEGMFDRQQGFQLHNPLSAPAPQAG